MHDKQTNKQKQAGLLSNEIIVYVSAHIFLTFFF